ncbi:MAG: preprotein translocase subunit SecE [Prevotella sp.]|nr:preprotein translocase subunit SecE [Prevotella sp.]
MFKKIVDTCKRFGNYCNECYKELAHKTTWPTYKELSHSAMVVLTASLIIALVVFVMDVVFKNLMLFIYNLA